MRQLLASLCALALLVSQACANNILINPYFFTTPPAATVAFLQCSTSQSGTTINFTSQSVGTASADRVTIIGVLAVDAAATFGVNAVTVGGDSATEIVDEDGTGLVDTAIYALSNPSGTSETVSVTMSEAVSDAVVCLWRANNLLSITAVAQTADDDTASGNLVLTLSDTSSDGIAVGVCANQSTGASATWTGLSEQFDLDRGSLRVSAADSTTSGGSLTVGCDFSGSADASGVTAAFR